MSLRTYIKRGFKYVMSGQPERLVKPEIVSLAPTELLLGKTALVTGGTSGIGRAIAASFLNAGGNVIITSRSEESAENVANLIGASVQNKNGRIYGIELNNKDVATFEYKIDTILSLPEIKQIDILVNNAGINSNGSYNCTEEAYDAILETNLKGMFFLSRCVAEYMIKNHIEGNILNIASASSLRPAISPYILSKWGVRGMTLGLAKKYIKHNIVVNGIAPGATATPMLGKNSSSDITLPQNPSGRYALPEEIANMAVVMTSSLGRLIVGDIVYMTGGAGILTYDDINY